MKKIKMVLVTAITLVMVAGCGQESKGSKKISNNSLAGKLMQDSGKWEITLDKDEKNSKVFMSFENEKDVIYEVTPWVYKCSYSISKEEDSLTVKIIKDKKEEDLLTLNNLQVEKDNIKFELDGSDGSVFKGSLSKHRTEDDDKKYSLKERIAFTEMSQKLGDNGISINLSDYYFKLNREKSIDYDYFELRFAVSNDKNKGLYDAALETKKNISGELETHYYDINGGRIVEKSYGDSDINTLSKVLETVGYSDKELLELAKFNLYYTNKDKK